MVFTQSQKRIFSILATVLLVTSIVFGYNIQPVKAESNMAEYVIQEDNGISESPQYNAIDNAIEQQNMGEEIVRGVIVGTATTALTAITLTGGCYLVDLAATSVFPPAIALAPACNMIGVSSGLTGAGNAILQVVK